MNPEIQIVQLTPDEWPAYKQIRLEALLDSPQAFGSTYAETIQRPDEHWQMRLRDAQEAKDNWLVFARAADRIVGLTGAFRDDDGLTAHVISVYVTPEYRGQGVGAALMQAVLDALALHADIHKARLGVNPLQSAALGMYLRFGFVEYRREQALMGDGKIYEEIFLEKELRHGETGLEKER